MTSEVLGWARERIKFIADINPESLPETTDEEFTFDYVDISRVTQGSIDPNEQLMTFREAPSRARRLARPGDTIISTVRTYLRAVAEVQASGSEQVFSTGFAVVRPKPNRVHPRFLTYYLQSDRLVDRVVADSVGVSYPAINASDIAHYDLWLPTIPDQRAIADFLDRETAQIDALIEAQQDLVARVIERRAAVRDTIAEAGLSSTVPLKRRARVTVGIVVTPSEWYADEGAPALRGTNVRDESFDLVDLVRLTEDGHLLHRKSRLAADDVAVVRTGQAGKAACIPPEMDGWNAIDLLLVRPSSLLLGDYLAMVLNSTPLHEQVAVGSVGAIQGHFNVESLANLAVPDIPVHEQMAAVHEWRNASSRMDTMIDAATDAIALMRERRAALISDAVTGRIDPRTCLELEVAV